MTKTNLCFIYFRNFELQLVPNRRLVSPEFRVWTDLGQESKLSAVDPSCHFLHSGPNSVAAFSACRDHSLVSITHTSYNISYYYLDLIDQEVNLNSYFSAWSNCRRQFDLRGASSAAGRRACGERQRAHSSRDTPRTTTSLARGRRTSTASASASTAGSPTSAQTWPS